MPSNVEIKARVLDIKQLRKVAAELSGSDGEVLMQQDTFFECSNGRLKLRHIEGRTAQLIYYSRPDEEGPKLSEFNLTLVENPESLRETLGLALGKRGEVKKRRTLYMVGQTRVHVDEVEGLGDFMELEVMMQEGQTIKEGEKIANDLMEKLSILPEDLLTGAYLDLILKKQSSKKPSDDVE